MMFTELNCDGRDAYATGECYGHPPDSNLCKGKWRESPNGKWEDSPNLVVHAISTDFLNVFVKELVVKSTLGTPPMLFVFDPYIMVRAHAVAHEPAHSTFFIHTNSLN
eukprot:SAG11_NODE_747_length_7366_cov_7.215632_7_plen_108_part_00